MMLPLLFCHMLCFPLVEGWLSHAFTIQTSHRTESMSSARTIVQHQHELQYQHQQHERRRQRQQRRHTKCQLRASQLSPSTIEFQRDHGRGEDHLSAFLQEGDIVVYQCGTWHVDGVEVGDGQPPYFAWAKVENLQVVWTHNCEHGVLRGIALHEEETKDSQASSVCLCESDPMEFIEFGPEQLIARVSVEWEEDDDERRRTTAVPVINEDGTSFWMIETGQL